MHRLLPVFVVLAVTAAAMSGAGCATDRDRPKEKRERRYDGPVIDLHAHLVLTGAPDEAEQYRKNAADPRLQKVAAIVTAPAGKPDETKTLNDNALALQQENAKIVAVGSVHPADGSFALDELERLALAGTKIVALHPAVQGFDLADPRVAAVVQRCGERGIAVLIEGTADSSMFGKTVALALKYPQAQLIIAHMGFTDFHDAALLVLTAKNAAYAENVWFDVSITAPVYVNSPYEEQLAWVIRRFPKKVLFGSEFPLFTSGAAIDAVQSLGLTEGEQADVLYGNAARLLKL